MGLKSTGEYGVKKNLYNNFRDAFGHFACFKDVRNFFEASREQVVATVDGNVLFNDVAQSVQTFRDYCVAVEDVIRSTMASAHIVVVVFDEPASLTAAKREEQAKRDAQKKKKALVFSDDFSTHPETDDYGMEELLKTLNCRDIIYARPARERFFDAVCKQVLVSLGKTLREWSKLGHSTHILFDGLDPLGAERPVGTPRNPTIYGTSDELATFFAHEPIGEGDLKLSKIESIVRDNELKPRGDRHPLLPDVWVHLAITIDSDSIAIGLLDKGARDVENRESPNFAGMLVMRERGKRNAEGDYVSSYLCCDVSVLYNMIQTQMWSLYSGNATAQLQRTAMALLCLGFIACGCDFVEVKGLRSDLVLESVPHLIAEMKDLTVVDQALAGSEYHLERLVGVLDKLIRLAAFNYGERPRARKATVASLTTVGPIPLRRAVWTFAYWNHHEQTDTRLWGFSPPHAIMCG